MSTCNHAPIHIYLLHSQETIEYAAEELCKYINKMANSEEAAVHRLPEGQTFPDTGLRIGLFTDFEIDTANLDDIEKDDAIHISVQNCRGVIAGSNPRSVLFAVYRFLALNDCRWLRPGEDGETVPSKKAESLNASVAEKAFYRFRGNTSCGSAGRGPDGLEYILEKITWMPKVGLNTFFQEGLLYYLDPSHAQAIKAIKKRGLFYHSAGHGWPAAFFGVPAGYPVNEEVFAAQAEKENHYVALVDGKRDTGAHQAKPKGGPKNTELCYGNPEVRTGLARCVVDYARHYPDVDVLHFWLSDSMNIHCECELCRDIRPSDFYVMMLNEIDENLSKAEIQTRIAFLIYQDLLWPPLNETINNPDRFVMMFAPISRKFSEPYNFEADEELLGSYAYNRNPALQKMAGFAAAVKSWRQAFKGESFTFDYHMTWYHYFDFGYYDFAAVMAEDIKRLPVLDQSGFVSCQIVCAAMPTGFPLRVHADYLWNPKEDFEKLAEDYFTAAFGADGKLCREYLRILSDLSCRDFFYKFNLETNHRQMQEVLQKLDRIPATIENFKPVIQRNRNRDNNPSLRRSWEYLAIHSELILLLSRALRAKTEGNDMAADSLWQKTVQYIKSNENRINSVFDFNWFHSSFNKRIFNK